MSDLHSRSRKQFCVCAQERHETSLSLIEAAVTPAGIVKLCSEGGQASKSAELDTVFSSLAAISCRLHAGYRMQ